MAESKHPKFIIFDCDGVLIDSEILANRVEVEVKIELGFPITLEEQITKFTGIGMTHPIMQQELARLPENYWALVDERVRKVYLEELRPLPGVESLLQKLSQPKCVASSSEPDWLEFKLSITKLKPFFPNAVFHGKLVRNCKPAPDLFFHAVKEMGWTASDCLVIEDSEAGVKAGRAAGMKVCGFLGGSHILPGHAERLKEAGANFLVSDFNGLSAVIA